MAVGLTVGGWFVSSIVNNLITALISYAADQYKLQFGLKEELDRVEKDLPKIQAVLSVVDGSHMKEKNPKLEEWLWQFRDAVDEAEDFMDEVEYYRLGKKIKVSPAASRFKTIIKRMVHQDPTLERLKEVVKGLDRAVAGIGDFVHLVNTFKDKQSLITSNRATSSLLPFIEQEVVGRDGELQKIINKLLNPSSASHLPLSVLPLIGVGGIGKTTLAQFVYNDKRIEKHFVERIWVCVSNNFDVLSLTKKIYGWVVDERHTTDNNLGQLQREIFECLKSKKVLLVLDDVWNDDDGESWGKLLAPFRSVECGSMILLTTRMEKVTKMMVGVMEPVFLKGMDEEDYWGFFKKCAFGDKDPKYHNKLQDIGGEIVKKLKGSPLAAKTVGGILRTNLNDDHWKNILNSEIWELEQGENDIMPALRLSYQYLPSHLKPCFTYCSMFPPDCELDKQNLVYMWVALGLVEKPTSGNRQPEDIANEYFNNLLSKSFFDCRNIDTDSSYVMHDLLHELAQFVSLGECSRFAGGKQECIPNTVRHLSIDVTSISYLKNSNPKNLRTLVLLDGDASERCSINLEMFETLKSLRVLILPPESTVTSLGSIGDLIHLRYLSLDYSSITDACRSVNRLYHLQVMRFTPPYFGYMGDSPLKQTVCFNLGKLRHLIMPGKSVANISGIGTLTSLQNLKAFRVEGDGHKICELKDLKQLRELSIQNLQNITNIEEAVECNLKNKDHLHTLSLQWDSSGTLELVEQVLDRLEPHSNLKVLKIDGYMGLRCPSWMTTRSFSELESIVFEHCQGWEVLPPLDQLPYLKSLCLENMSAVKQVGYKSNERYANSIFPSLEVLDISNCDSLEEWYVEAGTTQWFPCLRKLRVSGCPNLKLLSPLPCSLRELEIGDVALDALPKMWQGMNDSSLLSPSLASFDMHGCSSLVTLAEGLLLHPELFTALQKLSISTCPELKYLPVGGFRKLIFLTELKVKWCPQMQRGSTSESFLPSSLRSLVIDSCDHLDFMLSQDLQDLTFLSSLEIRCSPNITSLRSLEILGRWKSLQNFSIDNCPGISSLEGLQAVCPLVFLKVRCSRSAAASLLQSTLSNELTKEDEVENPTSMAGGTEIGRSFSLQPFSFLIRIVLSSLWRLLALSLLAIRIFSLPPPFVADVSQGTVEGSSLSIDRLHINDLSLLCTVPLRSLSARIVTIEISYELQSSLEQWVFQNRSSLQQLTIFMVNTPQFPPIDLQSFSCLQNLILQNAPRIQSLPMLPLSLKVLRIIRCSSMLEARCLKDSGPDWPKLSHIPTVGIGSYNKEQLETISAAEHSTRGSSTT